MNHDEREWRDEMAQSTRRRVRRREEERDGAAKHNND